MLFLLYTEAQQTQFVEGHDVTQQLGSARSARREILGIVQAQTADETLV